MGFNVAGTVSKIRSFLAKHASVGPASMKTCAENGLVVDLVGTGPAVDLPIVSAEGELPYVAHVSSL